VRVYWPIVEAYSVRGAWCWLATRAVLSLVRSFGTLPPLRVSTVTGMEIALLAVVVSVLETMHRRERSLIGNLAVHPALLVVCFAVPALAGEAALRLVLQA
jgi:hypothetical protein